MAYRRKRKRSAGIWYPLAGISGIKSAIDSGNRSDIQWGSSFSCPVDYAQAGCLAVTALDAFQDTVDDQYPGVGVGPTEFTGIGVYQLQHGVLIKRILGKIHLARQQNQADEVPACVVTAGVFVAPETAGASLPLPEGMTSNIITSASSVSEDHQWRQYSPLAATTQNQPWMWRRTWMLQNSSSTSNTGSLNVPWPIANWEYGSIADGPNVDIKTKRVVRPGDRLWFALATTPFPNGDTAAEAGVVFAQIDLRMFAKVIGIKRSRSFT